MRNAAFVLLGFTLLIAQAALGVLLPLDDWAPNLLLPIVIYLGVANDVHVVRGASLAFVLGYSIEDCRFTLQMMSAGRIDPSAMITDHISLDELPDAFEALKRPTHQCKVMLIR